MNLFIPSIGDKLELTKKWEFPLFFEYRNSSLVSRLRPGFTFSWNDNGSIMASFPKGTILRVDRIYIRKGKSDWDSVTFCVAHAPGDENRAKASGKAYTWAGRDDASIPEADKKKEQKLKGARFWVKLENVNDIVCKVVEDE